MWLGETYDQLEEREGGLPGKPFDLAFLPFGNRSAGLFSILSASPRRYFFRGSSTGFT